PRDDDWGVTSSQGGEESLEPRTPLPASGRDVVVGEHLGDLVAAGPRILLGRVALPIDAELLTGEVSADPEIERCCRHVPIIGYSVTERGGVPVQCLKRASDQGFYLLDFLLGSTEEFRSTISCLAFIPLTCAFSRPLRNLRRGPTLVSAVRERLWDAASAGQCCGGFTSFGARSLGRCADSKISLTQKSGVPTAPRFTGAGLVLPECE